MCWADPDSMVARRTGRIRLLTWEVQNRKVCGFTESGARLDIDPVSPNCRLQNDMLQYRAQANRGRWTTQQQHGGYVRDVYRPSSELTAQGSYYFCHDLGIQRSSR